MNISENGQNRLNSKAENITVSLNGNSAVPLQKAKPKPVPYMEPILSHFKVLGLWRNRMYIGTPIYRKLKPRGIALLTYLMLGIAMKGFCSVWFTVKIHGISQITSAVSDIFEMFVAYGTIGHLLYHQHSINGVFKRNWNSVENYTNSEIISLRRKNALLCCVPWFYVITLTCYSTCSLFVNDESMVTKIFDGVIGREIKWIKIMIRISMFLCYNLTRFICALSMVLYVSLCSQMILKLKKMNQIYKNVSNLREIKPETIKYFLSLWDGFCKVVIETDEIYSSVVALWYADFMHRMIFYSLEALEYLSRDYNGYHSSIFGTLYSILVGFYFILLTVMTWSASGISDTVEESRHCVRSLCCRLPHQADNMVYQNAIILISSFSNVNIHLTGWNCFVIRRYILLTAMGLVISYMMIIKQIIK